ncbi:NACHT-N domain-containing protein [Fusarium falciforme]|uniref:NACHT-N domain-containing protein n=1 Tax=Fusarium falciforme TaxID=195108 RepID=UPI0023015361|nr:NACHT-N domain-containing protein [Fusarium falciforme]WAO97379.1 NACHT-N domain-containing protein [Fusarium falciforme]
MGRDLSRIPTRIKRRLNKYGRTAMDEGNAPNSVDEHRAPTNQVQGESTSQLTSESSNQPTPELTEEVLEQSESGSKGQDASNPLAVASTDANVQSSNPDPKSSDASSRRSLWQQVYEKLCTEEDFGSKLLQYEKYVLAHAKVSASAGTGIEQTPPASYLEKAKANQSLLQEWVRKELENLLEQRIVIFRQGKQVVDRDKIYGVIKFIVKYKDLVKAGVSADPTAVLAWGGAMAIIPFLQNVFQQDEDAATGFEDICFLILQSNVVEHRLNELRQSEQCVSSSQSTEIQFTYRVLDTTQRPPLL